MSHPYADNTPPKGPSFASLLGLDTTQRRARPGSLPWGEGEDDVITAHFRQANGAFIPYQKQAECLNKMFHGGKPVRTGSAVRRREIALLKPNAKTEERGTKP